MVYYDMPWCLIFFDAEEEFQEYKYEHALLIIIAVVVVFINSK